MRFNTIFLRLCLFIAKKPTVRYLKYSFGIKKKQKIGLFENYKQTITYRRNKLIPGLIL